MRIVARKDTDALEHVRHSTAHVLAQAVLELWPGATFAGGPPIEDGFYYNFELPGGATFSDDDLARIEDKMREIIRAGALRAGLRSMASASGIWPSVLAASMWGWLVMGLVPLAKACEAMLGVRRARRVPRVRGRPRRFRVTRSTCALGRDLCHART